MKKKIEKIKIPKDVPNYIPLMFADYKLFASKINEIIERINNEKEESM